MARDEKTQMRVEIGIHMNCTCPWPGMRQDSDEGRDRYPHELYLSMARDEKTQMRVEIGIHMNCTCPWPGMRQVSTGSRRMGCPLLKPKPGYRFGLSCDRFGVKFGLAGGWAARS
jgi:hypothetical protein